jgi:hypothetical protein
MAVVEPQAGVEAPGAIAIIRTATPRNSNGAHNYKLHLDGGKYTISNPEERNAKLLFFPRLLLRSACAKDDGRWARWFAPYLKCEAAE